MKALAQLLTLALLLCPPRPGTAAAFKNIYGKFPTNALPGDAVLMKQLHAATGDLKRKSDAELHAWAKDWQRSKHAARKQLFDMLGLNPLPEKTDLKATITGTIDHPEFTVEKLHFQSRPGLYVTANFYLPKNSTWPVPTILYVCGHARVVTNGISYGSKVSYQHHPIWFARNGYACLIIDSVELGEILGQHHGTYRDNRWWWNSRGYTAAAAETWNCIRALDYLETRPEVDKSRLGVTGRSGGGAYSWWIAALDDRIKAACPVAGITDLRNHVLDGVVEGHCDCMFMVNTYRWDYAQVAALVAPRPLLICNSDKDTIFPLDGVVRLHERVRDVYNGLGASDRLGLLITEGPHADTQDLQIPVFRWFNRWLKNETSPIEKPAVRLFSGEQLKVFDKLPEDEKTSTCDETFTVLASDEQPFNPASARRELLGKTFAGWPGNAAEPRLTPLSSVLTNDLHMRSFEFESEPGVALRVYLITGVKRSPRAVHLRVLDEKAWQTFGGGFVLWPAVRDLAGGNEALIFFVPRGVGDTVFTQKTPFANHLRRRFMLLGQTLPGMQVWDVRRVVQAARQIEGFADIPLHVSAEAEMTEVAAFAAAFEPGVSSLSIAHAPRGDKEAPDFLNWSRILTPRQLLALTRANCPVAIRAELKPGGSSNAE